MKKFMAFITTALCVMLFVGCGEQKGDVTGQIQNYGTNTGSKSSYSGELVQPTFENLEEYRQYISEKKTLGEVPECFLEYEDLSFLGSFRCAVFSQNSFNDYTYSFIEKTGVEFYIYVYHEMDTYMKENPRDLTKGVFPETVQPKSTKDMRVFGEGEDVSKWHYYIHENIRYAFFDGKLEHISWYANGTYCLMGTANSGDYAAYPLTANTFQSKLLNLDTAVQAITEHFGTPQPIEDFYNQG